MNINFLKKDYITLSPVGVSPHFAPKYKFLPHLSPTCAHAVRSAKSELLASRGIHTDKEASPIQK